MPWIVLFMTCRLMGLAAASQWRLFSASGAQKSFLPLPWRPRFCVPHKTLLRPCRPLRLPSLADLLLLLRETSIADNTFSTTARPIMVKWDWMASQDQHLLPCKSERVVSCSGCCDRTRSRGRASRWCVSIRPWRGNAHIWCGLYLLPALFLDECRLFSSSTPLLRHWGLRVWEQKKSMLWFFMAHINRIWPVWLSSVLSRSWECNSSNLRAFNFTWLRSLDTVRWTWQWSNSKGWCTLAACQKEQEIWDDSAALTCFLCRRWQGAPGDL